MTWIWGNAQWCYKEVIYRHDTGSEYLLETKAITCLYKVYNYHIWWPGDAKILDINKHDIDLRWLQYADVRMGKFNITSVPFY